MKRRWIPFAVIAILLAMLSSFQVAEGSYGIVMRFGKPVKVIEKAGLHFKLPSPIDTVQTVDMRMHLLDPEPGTYLTEDKKNLLVDSFLVWSVADPLLYYRSVGSRGGAEARLADVVRSVVGDVLSSYDFESIVSIEGGQSGLAQIAQDLQVAAAQRAESTMGLKIHSAQVKRLNFPDQNKRAVFSRMESERQAISAGFRSQGKEEYDQIKAQTDREEAELLAAARRTATELRGTARAEAARIYAQAYDADPELYAFLRKLEAAEASFGAESTIVLPADHPLLKVLSEFPEASSSKDDE